MWAVESNIYTNLISRNLNHRPTFCRWWYGSIFIQIFRVGSVERFSARVRLGRSRSSKVIDFGMNRKRVYDFLLVRHSNLVVMLSCQCHLVPFQRYCRFLLMTPLLFHPNFGGVFVGPDRRCWGQCEQVPWAIRPWNYFRSIPTYVITVPERHGQSDGQTTYCGITALCVASRSKNESTQSSR